MARPQNLAEVAEIARARPADFALALDEFTDEFYLDHGNKRAQQDRLDAVPVPVGDARVDAWIGAVGEHLAQRWGLHVPPWTQREEHCALEQPIFSPDSRALRGVLIVESPPAGPGCCSPAPSPCKGHAFQPAPSGQQSRWSGRSAMQNPHRPSLVGTRTRSAIMAF